MQITIKGQPFVLKFRHRRFDKPLTIKSLRYRSRQPREVIGHTSCRLLDATGKNRLLCGEAWCSILDVPDPAIGRKEALRHMLEDWRLPREERCEIWEQYWRALREAEARKGERS